MVHRHNQHTCANGYTGREDTIMKMYRVLPEYYDLWVACEGECTISEAEIIQYAIELKCPVEELMEQVEEI